MVRIITANPHNPVRSEIAEAVRILKAGGIAAYPTETFYGLAAASTNETAIERIFAVKGRDEQNPLSLIIGNESQLTPLVSGIPAAARQLADRFWPGGITILFEASPLAPTRLTGGTGKIGIRLSSNPIASLLADELGCAITATSANQSGAPECTSCPEVARTIGNLIDIIIDGGVSPGPPGTTIVDATVDPPRILREGLIPRTLILHRPAKT